MTQWPPIVPSVTQAYVHRLKSHRYCIQDIAVLTALSEDDVRFVLKGACKSLPPKKRIRIRKPKTKADRDKLAAKELIAEGFPPELVAALFGGKHA